MATLKEIRERARAAASTARKRLGEGAKATGLRARALGRAVSTGASKQRRAFCARSAPPPSPGIVKAVIDRAIMKAAPKLGRSAKDLAVEGEASAVAVAGMVRAQARKSRLAKQIHDMAMKWSWWLASKDPDDLRDAYRYALNALDEAGS